MYQVLARKWRPQTFDALVGQSHISKTLSNAITSNRLAHAYIFAGLRGTGKTTVARILAKCLNCERGPGAVPCDKCDACKEIADSRAMDVMEIDAASRTKVEQTRELLEVVAYAPVRDRNKVLIIDEAHMLSKASFNALLKTLEEPPPNVVFILATTEIGKILPTILSRCQVFEFRRVGVRELVDHLRRVCDAEKVEISASSLERIARAGEGSVRDSLSVLERVLAFCGQQVGDDDVLRLLGGVRAEVLAELVGGLARRDAGAMLSVLDAVADEGHDLNQFWGEIVAVLRDLLLIQALPDRSDLLARSPEESGLLREAAEGLSSEDLTRAFKLVADLEFPLRGSTRPRFLFEAALLRLASLGAVRPIEQFLRSLEETGESATETRPRTTRRAANKPKKKARGEQAELIDRLVEAVQVDKPMLGAILEQASAVQLRDNDLVLLFAPHRASVARTLQRKENMNTLGKHAKQLVGRPVDVRVESGRPAEKTGPAPASSEPERRPLVEQATREPGVKKLLREFGAHVVDIQPLKPGAGSRRDRKKNRPVEESQ